MEEEEEERKRRRKRTGEEEEEKRREGKKKKSNGIIIHSSPKTISKTIQKLSKAHEHMEPFKHMHMDRHVNTHLQNQVHQPGLRHCGSPLRAWTLSNGWAGKDGSPNAEDGSRGAHLRAGTSWYAVSDILVVTGFTPSPRCRPGIPASAHRIIGDQSPHNN